ncbi:MAG: glycerol-3-phosphate 1-O-acyltransferase PlsY [Ruminococcaceae bacterium]|nr:glycerol-3-phosphate 1-O-acyltransferase PlsY [Oscillospiraceae bacterium]
MFWVWGIYDLFHTGIIHAIRSHHDLGDTAKAVLFGVGLILVSVISYLLGSINWALVISRIFYHDDVRKHGSGNAGTTNVLRTYGRKAAIFTFLGDGCKGILSIVVACIVFGSPYDSGYRFMLITAAYLAAFFCVLGHIFPCFARFHGGKGFATTALSILALNPAIWLILAAVFITLVLGSHFVSLGSVITSLLYPVLLHSFDSAISHYGIGVIFAFFIAMLVTWSHRENLKRIMNHTERKTYFFKKKQAPAEQAPEQSKGDHT